MASQPLHSDDSNEAPIEYYSTDDLYAVKVIEERRRNGAAGPRGDLACCCHRCRREGRGACWPRHYVGTPARSFRDIPVGPLWQSYECHIEGHTMDPELEEDLNRLRNYPDRVGAVIAARGLG